MTLADLKNSWVDEESYHKEIHESFIENVNSVKWMADYRTWIENNVFGFGERSFLWLWKLVVDEMPSEFSFLECGIFKGQILALIKMLASATGHSVERYGVSPLDSTGINWESNYSEDIITLHDTFFIPKDYVIYKGLSTNENIIEQAHRSSPYNIIYIDGSHIKIDVDSDFKHYAPMVKRGGYLVVDDAACRTHQPFGFFQGIKDVCDSLEEWEKSEIGKEFEFQFNIVHLMIYKRI